MDVAQWKSIVPWGLVVVALGVVAFLVVRYYLEQTVPEAREVSGADAPTVFVDVDNELEATQVDTISKVVLQARDSVRVDIPRR